MTFLRKKNDTGKESQVRRLTFGKKKPISTQIKSITSTTPIQSPVAVQPMPTESIDEGAQQELFYYKNWARFADIMQIQNGQTSEDWANHFLQHLIPFVKNYSKK